MAGDFGLGYQPDTVDLRDVDVRSVLRATPVPPLVPRMEAWTRTMNQGGLGSCVANAVLQAVRASELQQLVGMGHAVEDAQAATPFGSRLFVYYLARAVMHTTQTDSGSRIRDAFRAINTHGFPPETVWPYSDSNNPLSGLFARMPSSDAFRAAFDQRLTAERAAANVISYSRVFSTGYDRVDDVKRANAAGHLVVFGTDVSQKFASDDSANGGRPIPPPVNEPIAGGHAMVWGGYDADSVWTLNSWGSLFGDNGWFRMSWDYVAWQRTGDIWIVERAPLYSGQS